MIHLPECFLGLEGTVEAQIPGGMPEPKALQCGAVLAE